MPNLPWGRRTLVQLTLIGVCDQAQIVNTHHFEASSAREATLTNDGLAQAFSAEIADHWIANVKDEYLSCHGNDYRLDMVKSQVLERPANFRHKLTAVERAQTTGNLGTAPYPAAVGVVCIVIRWRTPQSGKSGRGRTYIGPIPGQWMVDGQRNVTESTSVPAYGNAMLNTYGVGGTTGSDYVLTIYSRPYNAGEYQYATRKTGSLTVVTPPDYAGNSTNVTAMQVDPVLRTQRRRELGVGS